MNKSIGIKLRKARLEKSFSIGDVSQATFIKSQYIKDLENGDFDALPTVIQLRGFLRSYADFLGLDGNEIITSLNSALDSQDKSTSEIDQNTNDSEIQNIVLRQETTQTIFEEIGAVIKSRRDILGLSIEDIEEHTHIPLHYIKMIEVGELQKFPSPTQARGMLSNYVSFLDMDIDSVLLRYADALQVTISETRVTKEEVKSLENKDEISETNQPTILDKIKPYLTSDLIIISSLGIILVIFITWGIGNIMSIQDPNDTLILSPTNVINSTSSPTVIAQETVNITPLDTVSEIDSSDTTETPSLPTIEQNSIQVFLVIKQSTYLKVLVDGIIEFDGRTTQGANFPFSGSNQIELVISNGAAVQIFFNNQDLGTSGIFGEVINIIYTQNGAATPTSTISPTPLLEDEPTTTPTPQSESPTPGG